ncbi:MAG: hypothetical protein KGI27_14880, partial [Thaumarchaeota archaeon]|nr:hypothetical protein [Nitrososphaerota archaeon]
DSSGDATLNIEPALRIRPADSNSLITSSPSAVFAFSKANSNMSYTAPRIAAFSMALTEDLLL